MPIATRNSTFLVWKPCRPLFVTIILGIDPRVYLWNKLKNFKQKNPRVSTSAGRRDCWIQRHLRGETSKAGTWVDLSKRALFSLKKTNWALRKPSCLHFCFRISSKQSILSSECFFLEIEWWYTKKQSYSKEAIRPKLIHIPIHCAHELPVSCTCWKSLPLLLTVNLWETNPKFCSDMIYFKVN